MSPENQEPVLLDATLRASPPLSAGVLKIVLAIVVAFNVGFGLAFVLRGAWPVAPFMGLDVLLLAWAFRASRRAALRHERVMLTPSSLIVEHHPPHGPASAVSFNPYWVRVDMADPPDHWSQLTLRSHGRVVKIGSFLAPQERFSFAQLLKDRLQRAREMP